MWLSRTSIVFFVCAIFVAIHAKATPKNAQILGESVEDIRAVSRPDHLTLFRPGHGLIWILQNVGGLFHKVYAQGRTENNEIGGYSPGSPNDRAITFDYDHSGIPNHILFYSPGANSAWILKNSQGSLSLVPHAGNHGGGIGGYNLSSLDDKALAFDYDHSGNLDHLVLYRPGNGSITILKNDGGVFSPVFNSYKGIGGYDLTVPSDRIFAYDCEHTGKLDHLVLYRPGTGAIFILKNDNGVFLRFYSQGAPGKGIGGFPLTNPADLGFAFDYNGSGKLDYLVFYSPGSSIISIITQDRGNFYKVFNSDRGIGGYDLSSRDDRIFPFDYNKTGKQDHLVLTRAGTGMIWILKNENGKFRPVYQANNTGIGGYDLKSVNDQIFALDYLSGS